MRPIKLPHPLLKLIQPSLIVPVDMPAPVGELVIEVPPRDIPDHDLYPVLNGGSAQPEILAHTGQVILIGEMQQDRYAVRSGMFQAPLYLGGVVDGPLKVTTAPRALTAGNVDLPPLRPPPSKEFGEVHGQPLNLVRAE